MLTGGSRLLTVATLTLMFTVGAMIKFVVNLPSILTTETKIASDLLQSSSISYHHVKALKSILAVFLFKLSLKFIGRLDVKLITPMRYCRSTHVEQTSNLCISQSLNLYFFTNKLFYT